MSRISILIICFALSLKLDAQLYIGNFIGDNSEQINGTWNVEVPLGFPIPIKKWEGKHKIVFYPSYTYSQTFFNDKWIFDSDGTTTTAVLDDDPAHEYRKSIFTHQSKIRQWAWEAWLGFETKIGKTEINFFYTPSFIQVGSFRRRYVEGNEVVKVVDRFRDKADYYNINRFQHRLKGSLSLYGIGVGAYLNLTPFFKQSTGIDLTKFGLTLVIRESIFNDLFDIGDIEIGDDEKNPDVKEMMF